MFTVEMYVQVRRACMVEGMSVREASRVFGLYRDTVRKMLAYSVPRWCPVNRCKSASSLLMPVRPLPPGYWVWVAPGCRRRWGW